MQIRPNATSISILSTQSDYKSLCSQLLDYKSSRTGNGGKLYVVSGSIKNFNIFVKSGGELYLNNNAFLTCDFNDEIRIEEGGVVEMENGVSIEMVGNSTMY